MAVTPTFGPSDIPTIAAAHALWLSSGGLHGTQADFTDLDLSGGYDLRTHNWSQAKFPAAVLSSTPLDPCTLTDADLTGTEMNWGSHYLMQELFRQAYPSDPTYAPYIAQVTELMPHCWEWFLTSWPLAIARAAYQVALACVVTPADADALYLIGTIREGLT